MASKSEDDKSNDYVSEYNKLPSILDAWKAFAKTADRQKKLSDDPSATQVDLMKDILGDDKLKNLLQKGPKGENLNQGGLFGFWILHRHYKLKAGERMVSSDKDASLGDDPQQVAERWGSATNDTNPKHTGLEYQLVSKTDADSPKVPSAKFFSEFERHMTRLGAKGIFGLCLAPKSTDNKVLIEKPGTGDRTQVTLPESDDDDSSTSYQSLWAPSGSSSDTTIRSAIRCIHKCLCTTSDKGAITMPTQTTAPAVTSKSSPMQIRDICTSPGAMPSPPSMYRSRSFAQNM
ncbi:hypothetical protein D9619_002076 [Psilocybe cf. subviscida]|uniref:Uncharacterized protein n=1 Tax=Psilocybe cf. subviscida TaxID=2480587 RepID=A0A8H5BD88_9AGAR|nr:hypothetical protein D9619_002076 [Psilocybe cf. subviscida]